MIVTNSAQVQKAIETYFGEAIESGLLRYEIGEAETLPDGRITSQWVAIQYKQNYGATRGDGDGWAHLFSCDAGNYYDWRGQLMAVKLINRITLMLAEKCRSLHQDVNILLNEQKQK